MTRQLKNPAAEADEMNSIRQEFPKYLPCGDSEYKALIYSLPDAVLVMDIAGNITAISEQTLTLFGFSKEHEITNKKFFEFIAPESKARAVIYLHKTLKQGLTQNLEYTFLKKTGPWFHIMDNISDASGTVQLERKKGTTYRISFSLSQHAL